MSKFDEMTEMEYCEIVREYANLYTAPVDADTIRLDMEDCIAQDGGDGFIETLTPEQFTAFINSIVREAN